MSIASDTSGTCAWEIDDDGVLTIGAGTLGTWNHSTGVPWYEYTSKITKVDASADIVVSTGYYMFAYCSSLTSLDLSGFDTSNVTNMIFMFRECSSLTSLDVSGFDTSNVTEMNAMFDNCSSLTSLDVSGFDTSNVTSMNGMFENCRSLRSLDVSGFDTSNVTSMYGMFENCRSLTSLDVSNFDTSNLKSMSSMFYGCSSLGFIKFGSSFVMPSFFYEFYIIQAGICSKATNTTTLKSVTSDDAFYKLSVTARAGVWVREGVEVEMLRLASTRYDAEAEAINILGTSLYLEIYTSDISMSDGTLAISFTNVSGKTSTYESVTAKSNGYYTTVLEEIGEAAGTVTVSLTIGTYIYKFTCNVTSLKGVFTLDHSGNAWVANGLTVGGESASTESTGEINAVSGVFSGDVSVEGKLTAETTQITTLNADSGTIDGDLAVKGTLSTLELSLTEITAETGNITTLYGKTGEFSGDVSADNGFLLDDDTLEVLETYGFDPNTLY